MTTAQTIYLKDYTPFGYEVQDVHLTFDLSAHNTRVRSRIRFAPKNDASDKSFFLHGEQLKFISAKIDGNTITPEFTDQGLTCPVPDGPFVWECEVEIDPAANTSLEGLYQSSGMYCTQCEAEGFRKITYYPDRPDVMSVFTVRINGDYPVLLSNGNPSASGDGWAEWHDPWPKPAYLFALVAGDLVSLTDQFTTRSGREVALNVYVRAGDLHKCDFAMQALKKSMTWDEQVYGREYDLDIFNIVAVDDFNMGAMENKGLNIFNSSAVLASPETATDDNFERIEAIIAHEYFHNWTGNRITCRDWFQLCLKEGLTVYRDSQFTSDLRSKDVKRISDVIELRARQFPEDQGPLSHPVRPESFQEISNFYTATVYDKGAEVIGMLRALVGADAYSKAVDLYFDRHDGQACTIEDWLAVFEESTGRDLTQFKRWYSQAGTPTLKVEEAYENDTYTLTFTQSTPQSATTPEPKAQVIPVAVGLLGQEGHEISGTQILEVTKERQSFEFKDIPARPVASVLRGFSAPVVLEHKADHGFLLAHDTDPFNRWEAANALSMQALLDMIQEGHAPNPVYLDGLKHVLEDRSLDPAYRALMLGLPSQSEVATRLHALSITPDPDAIWQAGDSMRQAQAQHFGDLLQSLYQENQVTAPYQADAEQSGMRSLANAALSLISRIDDAALAQEQFDRADNMTLQLSSLAQLIRSGHGEKAINDFATQWKDDRLVMDKWFSMQIIQSTPDKTTEITEKLTQHPDFNHKNPNRFRATLGALAMHHAGFHAKEGRGYKMLADWLITLDPINPQTTARMCSPFQTWRRYDSERQGLISAQLNRIAQTPNLSRDTAEMIGRILAQ